MGLKMVFYDSKDVNGHLTVTLSLQKLKKAPKSMSIELELCLLSLGNSVSCVDKNSNAFLIQFHIVIYVKIYYIQ